MLASLDRQKLNIARTRLGSISLGVQEPLVTITGSQSMDFVVDVKLNTQK